MCKRRGFTLVELLVVIAIIALLMSVLMPALARVRKQARGVLCLSNLNQFGKCYAMYAGDWDGSTPRGWWESGQTKYGAPNNFRDYWMQALRKSYGAEGDIRCCPSAMKLSTDTGPGNYSAGPGIPGVDATEFAWGEFPGKLGQPSTWWNMVGGTDYGSYGWNSFICNLPADILITQGHLTKNYWRSLNVKGASNVPLHTENQWIDGWPEPTDEPPEYRGQSWGGPSDMRRFCLDRHTDHGNVLFMDISARAAGLKELWTLKWHTGYDTAGPWTIAGFNGNKQSCAAAWDAEAPWMSAMPEY